MTRKESMEVKKVPFLGEELMAFRDNKGQIWAGVRWICNGIGLSEGQRKRQITNIQADRVLSKGGSNLVLNATGYGDREVFCLKIDYVPLWLAKISITPSMEKDAPDVADKLEQYQLKAKDVLAKAFSPETITASVATPKLAPPSVPLSALVRLMEFQERIMKEKGCTAVEISAMAKATMEAYGVPVTKVFAKDVNEQMCLFEPVEIPALTGGGITV